MRASIPLNMCCMWKYCAGHSKGVTERTRPSVDLLHDGPTQATQVTNALSSVLLVVRARALCLAISAALWMVIGCGAAGRDGNAACTLMSCRSLVTVDIHELRSRLAGAETVTLCLDQVCARRSAREPRIDTSRGAARHGKGPYELLVIVRDREGNVLLSVHRVVTLLTEHPNGRRCRGSCFFRAVVLDARHHRVVVE
jgi:hypothetical protein